jgi:hypothetical protein
MSQKCRLLKSQWRNGTSTPAGVTPTCRSDTYSSDESSDKSGTREINAACTRAIDVRLYTCRRHASLQQQTLAHEAEMQLAMSASIHRKSPG